jgi:arylformamidase
MSWIYLSHVLKESTPLYGGKGKIVIERVRSISEGDTSNNTEISMPAHAGTHVDAPFHFDPEGKTLEDYPADYWRASKPALVNFRAEPGMVLRMEHLREQLEQIPKDVDLLLLKTGAEEWRSAQQNAYCEQGVGLGTDVADWLRSKLNLKFIGLDFISVSSPLHRQEGRVTHKVLLGKNHSGEPIIIVEDMALAALTRSPESVWIVPIRFSEADGGMATVLAEV